MQRKPECAVVRAQPRDAEALTRIAVEAKGMWGYPRDWIERWESALTLTPGVVRSDPTYGAVENGDYIGFYSLRVVAAEAWMEHLWVKPAATRRGIGTALFRHGETVARQCGASVLKIRSDPNAEGFYRAMGAQRTGSEPAPMEGDETRVLPLLEKRLDPQ
jgi:GNAT superfamily N-acetyltransferase